VTIDIEYFKRPFIDDTVASPPRVLHLSIGYLLIGALGIELKNSQTIDNLDDFLDSSRRPILLDQHPITDHFKYGKQDGVYRKVWKRVLMKG